MSVQLLIIDPQNDFCSPEGALAVPGADADVDRLARWLTDHTSTIDAVTVTLDTHRRLDIAHGRWFVDPTGAHPAPFTAIAAADLRDGRWSTTDPAARPRTLRYLDTLEARGRYPHTIWPEHCLVGTAGHNVAPVLNDALQTWSAARHDLVEYVVKGLDPWTEHFSAIAAEVPDASSPSTQPNQALLDRLATADHLFVAGQASSHCVANTVRDLVTMLGDRRPKTTLLTDAMSPVTGFESVAEAFLADMTVTGLHHQTTAGTPR